MTQQRARRTRAELRELMLMAGKEVLLQIEASLGFEELTYSAVFRHLEEHHGQRVTIGSVHERIWKNQREFQLNVVAEILHEPVTPLTELALDRAVSAIRQLDLSTPDLRKYALRTAIRMNSQNLFVQPHHEAVKIAHLVRFRLWALGPHHPEAEGFTEAIREIRQTATTAYVAVAKAIIDELGLRVRPEAGDPEEAIESIAVLGNAVSLGLRTDVLDSAYTTRRMPTGLQGELEDWYPDSIALWAYASSMLELADDGLTAEERRL